MSRWSTLHAILLLFQHDPYVQTQVRIISVRNRGRTFRVNTDAIELDEMPLVWNRPASQIRVRANRIRIFEERQRPTGKR